ncbi:hypothetical protein EDB19DRAFT_1653296, partial [Suillus lakei]
SILVAAGQPVGRWTEHGIALGVIFVTLLHRLDPKTGSLSIFRIMILLFVVVTGWVVLSSKTHVVDPHYNFRNAFAGALQVPMTRYATAPFKFLNAYAEWSNVKYIMNNIRDAVRTLKIADPLGLGICVVLYLLANVAYFSAATKTEIEKFGVTVAVLFFANVFGSVAERALSVFIALR